MYPRESVNRSRALIWAVAISDWNAIVRLLFSLSMWILKSPMRILSEILTKVAMKSENSDKTRT